MHNSENEQLILSPNFKDKNGVFLKTNDIWLFEGTQYEIKEIDGEDWFVPLNERKDDESEWIDLIHCNVGVIITQ